MRGCSERDVVCRRRMATAVAFIAWLGFTPIGTCSTGACSYAPCDDGDPCMRADACMTGGCVRRAPAPPVPTRESPTTPPRTCGSTTVDADCPTGRNEEARVESTTARAISAGSVHTCVLTSAGAVKCWGHNYHGLLGDGSTVDSHVPVGVVGLSSGVRAISAGADHTCALTSTGAVKCWGDNHHGQLGDGSTLDSHVPVDVVGLSSGVVAISSTCAVTSAGAVKCWGENYFGQLGNGSRVESRVPVDVMGLSSGVAAVSSAGNDACALTTSGAVKCWGGFSDSDTPVDVAGLSRGVIGISVGGGFACALTTDGAVKGWGLNTRGEIGNKATVGGDRPVGPVDVVGLSSGVIDVSAGGAHTCAVTLAGAVKCLGDNTFGQLGDGSTGRSHAPVDVVGLRSGVIVVSAGEYHTCAITAAGGVKCWGVNSQGQLGDGSTTIRHIPVDVVGF